MPSEYSNNLYKISKFIQSKDYNEISENGRENA